MLSQPSSVLPGGWAYEFFLKWVPGLALFTQRVRVPILIFMIAIHLTETVFMSGTLRHYSIGVGTKVWWLWMASNFIEGYGAFDRYEYNVTRVETDKRRLSAMEAKQKIAMEKRKH
jgi:hypothetical protein